MVGGSAACLAAGGDAGHGGASEDLLVEHLWDLLVDLLMAG